MVFLGCNLHLLKTSFTDITVISVTSTEDLKNTTYQTIFESLYLICG